jgi:CRP-like cAMP-binding protein
MGRLVGTRRTADSKVSALAGLPLFRACSERQLGLVARLGEVVQVAPGLRLQREGLPGRSWFVLQRGSAAATRGGYPTALYGPGDCFGEAALLSGELSGVTVTTLTAATVFIFDRRAFFGLLGEVPLLSVGLLKTMARADHARELAETPALSVVKESPQAMG